MNQPKHEDWRAEFQSMSTPDLRLFIENTTIQMSDIVSQLEEKKRPQDCPDMSVNQFFAWRKSCLYAHRTVSARLFVARNVLKERNVLERASLAENSTASLLEKLRSMVGGWIGVGRVVVTPEEQIVMDDALATINAISSGYLLDAEAAPAHFGARGH